MALLLLLFGMLMLVPTASISWWGSALECCWLRSKSEFFVDSSPVQSEAVSEEAFKKDLMEKSSNSMSVISMEQVPSSGTPALSSTYAVDDCHLFDISSDKEEFVKELSWLLFPKLSLSRSLDSDRTGSTPPITPWLLDKLGLLLQVMSVSSGLDDARGQAFLLSPLNETARRLRRLVEDERRNHDQSAQWRRLTLHANSDAFERIFDLMEKILSQHIRLLKSNRNALASPLLQFLEIEVVPQLQKERELGRSLRLFEKVKGELLDHAEGLLTGPGFIRDRWFFEALQREEHWATENDLGADLHERRGGGRGKVDQHGLATGVIGAEKAEAALQALRDVVDGKISRSEGENRAFPWTGVRGGRLPDIADVNSTQIQDDTWSLIAAERCPTGQVYLRHKSRDPAEDIWSLAGYKYNPDTHAYFMAAKNVLQTTFRETFEERIGRLPRRDPSRVFRRMAEVDRVVDLVKTYLRRARSDRKELEKIGVHVQDGAWRVSQESATGGLYFEAAVVYRERTPFSEPGLFAEDGSGIDGQISRAVLRCAPAQDGVVRGKNVEGGSVARQERAVRTGAWKVDLVVLDPAVVVVGVEETRNTNGSVSDVEHMLEVVSLEEEEKEQEED